MRHLAYNISPFGGYVNSILSGKLRHPDIKLNAVLCFHALDLRRYIGLCSYELMKV